MVSALVFTIPHWIGVDPQFYPPIICPIKYLFDTLQQFLGSPQLLILLTFFEPARRLWLKDLSNLVVTLGSPNLDLGLLRHPRPIQIHLAHQASPQAHLDALDTFQLAHIHPRLLRQSFKIGHLDTSFGIAHLGVFLILVTSFSEIG